MHEKNLCYFSCYIHFNLTLIFSVVYIDLIHNPFFALFCQDHTRSIPFVALAKLSGCRYTAGGKQVKSVIIGGSIHTKKGRMPTNP